jgi:hypothetical protein
MLLYGNRTISCQDILHEPQESRRLGQTEALPVPQTGHPAWGQVSSVPTEGPSSAPTTAWRGDRVFE